MNIPDEQFEVIKGVKEGKSWQYMVSLVWKDQGDANLYYILSVGYRVRLKPESQKSPFSFEDIKPNMVFRKKGKETWRHPQLVGKTEIFFGVSAGHATWENLQKSWEWSTDATVWHNCEKEI